MELLLVWAAPLLYIFPPLWMVTRKGWPIRAGMTMLTACLLLSMPLFLVEGEMPPGGGLLALVLAPFVVLAMAVICGGLIAALVRSRRRRTAGL